MCIIYITYMYKYNISDAMRILWQLCAFLVHNFETKFES